MKNIINFISNIDNSTYNKIRHSKSDAECRRYLKEQLTKQLTLNDVVKSSCDNLEIDLGDKNCIHCGIHISEHKKT